MNSHLATKDTIDLVVTAAVLGTKKPNGTDHDSATDVVLADRIGQVLWDANYASASTARGIEIPAPTYVWQPVFDLMWQEGVDQPDYSLTIAQLLQIERSRLFLSENSREHAGWETSQARLFLQQLDLAITSRLRNWPCIPAEDPGVLEYLGLRAATATWTRARGFAPAPPMHPVEG